MEEAYKELQTITTDMRRSFPQLYDQFRQLTAPAEQISKLIDQAGTLINNGDLIELQKIIDPISMSNDPALKKDKDKIIHQLRLAYSQRIKNICHALSLHKTTEDLFSTNKELANDMNYIEKIKPNIVGIVGLNFIEIMNKNILNQLQNLLEARQSDIISKFKQRKYADMERCIKTYKKFFEFIKNLLPPQGFDDL